MKVRVTIETLDDAGAVDSASSYTDATGPALFDDQRALGFALAIALKGTLGQWSGNVPDPGVYKEFFESIDTGWGESLAKLCTEWFERDDSTGFDDFMERRLSETEAVTQ